MKHRPDSRHSPDKSPNSLIRSLVPFATATIAVLSAHLLISAKIDTGVLHIIGFVLTFSGILGMGVVKYRRYKHGYYYNAFALTVLAPGIGILSNAFFDWLY